MLFGSMESRNKLVQFSAALVSDKKLISIIVFLFQWKYFDGAKKEVKIGDRCCHFDLVARLNFFI